MRVILAIIMAVFIPLAALMVVLFEPVCFALADSSIPSTGMSQVQHDELVSVAMGVRDYSLGNDEANLPIGTDYLTSITPDALAHLLDVRMVFLACVAACAALLIALIVFFIIALKRKGAAWLGKPLIIGGVVPLAAAALLGLAVAIDFSAFFTWLHGIFFADGTWTFPADSLLIQSLPFNFWFACAVVWALCMVVLCAASIVAGIVLNRKVSAEVGFGAAA